MIEHVDHHGGRYALRRHIGSAKNAGTDREAQPAKILGQGLVHFSVRFVQPVVVERSALCEAGGKQADVRTDFQEISRHSAVPTQKTYIVLLRAFARRQWNRDHVLGLTAVKSIELTLSIVGAAKQRAAFRALEIRDANPRLRIAGEECAVTIGA